MGMLKSISILKCWRDGCDWRRKKREQEGGGIGNACSNLTTVNYHSKFG